MEGLLVAPEPSMETSYQGKLMSLRSIYVCKVLKAVKAVKVLKA